MLWNDYDHHGVDYGRSEMTKVLVGRLTVGSSGLGIIKKGGGVELIISEPLMIKKLILLNVTRFN